MKRIYLLLIVLTLGLIQMITVLSDCSSCREMWQKVASVAGFSLFLILTIGSFYIQSKKAHNRVDGSAPK